MPAAGAHAGTGAREGTGRQAAGSAHPCPRRHRQGRSSRAWCPNRRHAGCSRRKRGAAPASEEEGRGKHAQAEPTLGARRAMLGHPGRRALAGRSHRACRRRRRRCRAHLLSAAQERQWRRWRQRRRQEEVAQGPSTPLSAPALPLFPPACPVEVQVVICAQAGRREAGRQRKRVSRVRGRRSAAAIGQHPHACTLEAELVPASLASLTPSLSSSTAQSSRGEMDLILARIKNAARASTGARSSMDSRRAGGAHPCPRRHRPAL